MSEEQIQELFSDESFVACIMEKETPEEVQKELSGKGLELSLEEIKIIGDSLADLEEEMNEEELESVSGGSVTAVIGAIIIGAAAAGGAFQLGKAVDNWTSRRW